MTPLNVLLVTYSFPPAGGVGVLRAASLAKYLPAEGIRLDVLTTRNASAVGEDSPLLRQIPPEVAVHRTLTLDLPFGLKKKLKGLLAPRRAHAFAGTASAGRAERKPSGMKSLIGDMLLPDPQVTWYPIALRRACRIIRERKIELVLVTVPPFSTLLLVEDLRKKFPTLPIVVDFRDEWLTNIGLLSFSTTERAMAVARRTEASAVKRSTAIVTTTEAAREEIHSRYPELPVSKFHCIPNGYDSETIGAVAASPASQDRKKIVVTYVGTLYRTTDPMPVIEAIRKLPDNVKSALQFEFVGHIEEPHYYEALLSLGDMVQLRGFLPQKEALRSVKEADFALLISHDRMNIPAKFYDYIGAGKPVLAAVNPQGATRRMIEHLQAGRWADINDQAAIREMLIDASRQQDSTSNVFLPDKDRISMFERRVLSRRYAELLREVAASTR